jgi:DNA repair exonuclease SbcCD ATPase subunit
MIKLKKIKIKSFGSFKKEQVIDFPESGLLLLHGDNGSGKSSILKAIAYCLDFLSEPATDFINWDTGEDLFVELTLNLKNQDLIIQRGNGLYKLEYGNVKAQGTDVPKKIESLLLNPNFMAIMSYRGQGEGGNFSSLKPGEKQDFLSELQS